MSSIKIRCDSLDMAIGTNLHIMFASSWRWQKLTEVVFPESRIPELLSQSSYILAGRP